MLKDHANNHRGRMAAVVIGVLAASGVICVGVALADQPQPPPQPPLSVAEPASPPTTEPAPSPVGPAPSRTGASAPATILPLVRGPVIPASQPRAIAIPAIGVRSALLQLGLDAKGEMQTPQPGPDYNKAGWYRYSPTPGELGPAVIAGHIDSAKDGPSVFFRLGALRQRDTIKVTRADGSVAIFAVDEVRRYSKSRFPSGVIYGNTPHAALRLITCGGSFDRRSRNYVDNIVVYASLVRATGVIEPQVQPPPDRRRLGGV